MDTYDKNGRAIEIGDVLRVFHFVGGRRKRYFMYKQVVGETTLDESGLRYFEVSHLNLLPFSDPAGGYWLAKDGRHHDTIEIVQSVDCKFEGRARIKPKDK